LLFRRLKIRKGAWYVKGILLQPVLIDTLEKLVQGQSMRQMEKTKRNLQLRTAGSWEINRISW